MFSKACEYAIRAMVFIAQKSRHGNNVGIKEIARGIDSPEAFLAKILQQLSRKELVLSVKGPHGGFYLDSTRLKTTLAAIVEAIDGNQLFTGCGLGLEACSEKNPCPLHDEFKMIRRKIHAMLETTRVDDFSESLDKGLIYLKRF